MNLFEWWFNLPYRLGHRVPPVVKITLGLWVPIGIVIAIIPELQEMPPLVRLVLGAPAALGIMYMGIGVILKVLDGAIRLGARVYPKGNG